MPVRIKGMHPELLAGACRLYQTTAGQVTPLSGGNYNATYRYPIPKLEQSKHRDKRACEATQYGVLCIGLEDCPGEQTLGMLEWVQFLSEYGAPVTAPIASILGRLLERLEQDGKAYTITAFEGVDGTLAERIPPDEWTDELFCSIGRATGKMHAVSKRYHPSRKERTRPHWFASSEIRDATVKLAGSTDPAKDRLQALVEELKRLPVEPDSYGMIHDDLHFANFLVRHDGSVTIIDFDDCQYGWFAMDIAMALFDVLVLYPARSEVENRAFARHFMHHYLAGYREENKIDHYWQGYIPIFLKLKEICVYAPLVGHPEVDQPESWVGRFMVGRAERIANNVPYVDINFIDSHR
jgi:Ser/Thr protein kinase RdoA (MazF antagonist)